MKTVVPELAIATPPTPQLPMADEIGPNSPTRISLCSYLMELLGAFAQTTDPLLRNTFTEYFTRQPLQFEEGANDLPNGSANLDKAIQEALCTPFAEVATNVDWLIGKSLFDALMHRAQPVVDCMRVARLLGDNPVRLQAFGDAVASSHDAVADTIMAAMKALVENVRVAPEKFPGLWSMRYALPIMQERWAAKTDFGEIWNQNAWLDLDMFATDIAVLGRLLKYRPATYFPLVERLSAPPLIKDLLHHATAKSHFGDVLALLVEAPSIFIDHSNTWNRHVCAPLLLEIVFDRLLQSGTNRRTNAQPLADNVAISLHTKEIADHTLQRDDGIILLLRWMQHMVKKAMNWPTDSVFSTVFHSLLDQLASSEILIDQIYHAPAISHDKPAKRERQLSLGQGGPIVTRFILATIVAQARIDAGIPVPVTPLRSAFLKLLGCAAETFSLYQDNQTWHHSVFAKLYLSEPDPILAWNTDFDSFAQARRAHWHAYPQNDVPLGAPSLYLGWIGIALIDCYLTAENGKPALHVWERIFEATWPLFTQARYETEKWRDVASELFAHFPACARLHDTQPGVRARRWLNRLGGDEALFVTAITRLAEQGIAIADLAEDATEQVAMNNRLHDYLDWESRTQGRELSPDIVEYWRTNQNKL